MFLILATLALELLVLDQVVLLNVEMKGSTEQCDNGNQEGCSANCVPDVGYSCTGSVGSTSSCSVKCGDGILGDT